MGVNGHGYRYREDARRRPCARIGTAPIHPHVRAGHGDRQARRHARSRAAWRSRYERGSRTPTPVSTLISASATASHNASAPARTRASASASAPRASRGDRNACAARGIHQAARRAALRALVSASCRAVARETLCGGSTLDARCPGTRFPASTARISSAPLTPSTCPPHARADDRTHPRRPPGASA